MSDEQAIAQYRHTGRHLGIFRTPAEATAYAQSLHEDQAREYLPQGGFRGIPGETVTSTYRNRAHNTAVGGVSDSYHMRRDSKGRPLARDSTPPQGMGLSAYASRLRELNPDRDVILEGDHVHLEPRGRR